jgi:hypothetical protein
MATLKDFFSRPLPPTQAARVFAGRHDHGAHEHGYNSSLGGEEEEGRRSASAQL